MRIEHGIVYVGFRLYPCGATRVIADQIRGLRARGFDVHLVCVGLFAKSWFHPNSVTEMPGFAHMQITTQVLVSTSALATHLMQKGRIAYETFFQLIQGDETTFYSVPYPLIDQVTARGLAMNADGILVPSVGLATQIRKRSTTQCYVVWPYLDRSVFYSIRSLHAISANSLRILLVGNRSQTVKGLRYAYEAIRLLDGIPCELVRLASRRLDPKETCQESYINPPLQEIGDVYRSCNLLLFPSLSEGFGLPVLEAMACGVPVITTMCHGMRGWVKDHHNAFTVRAGEASDIAVAITRMTREPTTVSSLIENGLRTAEFFSEERSISRLQEVLQL